jgi:hypothetical protein
MRKCPDLVRNNPKTTTLLTRSRSFNCCIQYQQTDQFDMDKKQKYRNEIISDDMVCGVPSQNSYLDGLDICDSTGDIRGAQNAAAETLGNARRPP